jgi:hypothetical protein
MSFADIAPMAESTADVKQKPAPQLQILIAAAHSEVLYRQMLTCVHVALCTNPLCMRPLDGL